MSASKKLRLKVGRTYETASGQRVEILFFTGVYFAGRTGLYKADGTPRSLGTLPLIREVSAPKPARKPKRKAAKAVTQRQKDIQATWRQVRLHLDHAARLAKLAEDLENGVEVRR